MRRASADAARREDVLEGRQAAKARAGTGPDPGAQAGLSIDKLEEQLNLLKVNFKDKQGLVDVMSNACKGKMGNRRKSQVLYDNYCCGVEC